MAFVYFISGGSGFLGQHLVRELQKDLDVGEIRVLDLKPYHYRLGEDNGVWLFFSGSSV